jgi:hemoglobin
MEYAALSSTTQGMTMDVFEMRRRVTEDDVAQLVGWFYDRVRDDAQLGPVFGSRIEAQGWPRHLARMRDFWSTVLLGAGRYRGNPMAAHQSIPGIERVHFTRWLNVFEAVVRDVLSQEVAEAILHRAHRMGERLTASLGV